MQSLTAGVEAMPLLRGETGSGCTFGLACCRPDDQNNVVDPLPPKDIVEETVHVAVERQERIATEAAPNRPPAPGRTPDVLIRVRAIIEQDLD